METKKNSQLLRPLILLSVLFSQTLAVPPLEAEALRNVRHADGVSTSDIGSLLDDHSPKEYSESLTEKRASDDISDDRAILICQPDGICLARPFPLQNRHDDSIPLPCLGGISDTCQNGYHQQIKKQVLARMRRKRNLHALLVGSKTGAATVENIKREILRSQDDDSKKFFGTKPMTSVQCFGQILFHKKSCESAIGENYKWVTIDWSQSPCPSGGLSVHQSFGRCAPDIPHALLSQAVDKVIPQEKSLDEVILV